MRNNLNLSKRMIAIGQVIDKTTMLVDIGCDHGKMLDYVLHNKLADFVVGIDISEKSALKANTLLESKKYTNFSVMVSDGMQDFDVQLTQMVETILVAGLGGFEIKKIIKALLPKISNQTSLKQLVLQPQNNAVLLRQFLIKNGFVIEYDSMIKDKGKFYNIIKANYNPKKKQKLSLNQIDYGITNLLHKNLDFEEYLNLKYDQLENIIARTKKKSSKRQFIKEQKNIEKIIKSLYNQK